MERCFDVPYLRKLIYCTLVLTALVVFFVPMQAGTPIDSQREELFWASRGMAEERASLPQRHVALFTTTYDGDGNPVNLGAKLEMAMSEGWWFSVEAIQLKEDGIGGFISVKVYPFDRLRHPLYLGAGAALKQSVDYQMYAGVEIFKNMYAEVKYMTADGSFVAGNPYVALGFTMPF